MSEWRATVDPCKSAREYVPGLLVGHAVPKHGAQWVWFFFDEHALRGEPDGEAATEAEAQAACDDAAVAWVLVALARRLGQWATEIDAELARDYRAARAAYLQAARSDGYDYRPEMEDMGEALDRLVRGWP